MQLLIVRHAIAADYLHDTSAYPDDASRPLTLKGRRRMGVIAHGLRRLLHGFDLLATSPLVRAMQTADILAAAFDGPLPTQVPVLAPGYKPSDVEKWLAIHVCDVLALVGHEPDLSKLVGWLTVGAPYSLVNFKKGGVCLLECNTPLRAGTCTLQWLLTYKHFRTNRL